MRPLVSPSQMADADAQAIAGGAPTELLMDRAGRAVARAAIRLAGGRYGKHAAVVCGPGNNGGDGFVAARVLAREGVGVRCFLVGDLERVSGAAAHHLDRMRASGIGLDAFDPRSLRRALDVDVCIDALFGTGFRGRADGDAETAIEMMSPERGDARPRPRDGGPRRVIAVDIPSGVNGATGAVEGRAVHADVTVAMAGEKYGTAVGPGAVRAGRVEVADIGIPLPEEPDAVVVERPDVVIPERPRDAHKRTAGSVAILAGSETIRGAPLLTARGAVRAGAGYATLGTTRSVVDAARELPELLCVMVSEGDVLGPESLGAFGEVLERADSLAIGPGIGTGTDQQKLVEAVVTGIELPVVIDADGLNVLAGRPEVVRARPGPVVLTPHPAELARLLEMSTTDVQADRLGAARTAADRYSAIVILKGFHPVVAQPSGPTAVVPVGGPELATAGTGDVLTGIVAAFLARGVEPWRAAWTAAYVGSAAGSSVDPGGGDGILASDIADELPRAIAAFRDV